MIGKEHAPRAPMYLHCRVPPKPYSDCLFWPLCHLMVRLQGSSSYGGLNVLGVPNYNYRIISPQSLF